MSFGAGSSSTSPGRVWSGQAPYLQGLYQRAYGASLGLGSGGQMVTVQQPRNPREEYFNRVDRLFGREPGGSNQGGGYQGQGGQAQPGGPGGLVGGEQFTDPLAQFGGALAQQGQGFLGNLGMMGQAGNPYAQEQIGQLGQGLGRLFNQQIMPGIQSTFGQAGQLGGSRQALAQGQAAEGLGQAFTGGALDILGNSAQLALQANQAGLGGLGNVFDQGQNATFGSLPGLSALMGGPTILGGGSQSRDVNFGLW